MRKYLLPLILALLVPVLAISQTNRFNILDTTVGSFSTAVFTTAIDNYAQLTMRVNGVTVATQGVGAGGERVVNADFHIWQNKAASGEFLRSSADMKLQVNGDAIRVVTARTPASAAAACAAGTVVWDTSFVYVCVATNTWKRSAISTW